MGLGGRRRIIDGNADLGGGLTILLSVKHLRRYFTRKDARTGPRRSVGLQGETIRSFDTLTKYRPNAHTKQLPACVTPANELQLYPCLGRGEAVADGRAELATVDALCSPSVPHR